MKNSADSSSFEDFKSGESHEALLIKKLKKENKKLSEENDELLKQLSKTKRQFEKAIENDDFLEHAKYVENYYGTPRDYVEQKRNEGFNVVLEIDVQGGLQVMKKCPGAVSIFVLPPSLDDLKNRLVGRGTEKEETINKRVDAARKEIESGEVYKYHVVNEDIDKTVDEVVKIIEKEMDA